LISNDKILTKHLIKNEKNEINKFLRSVGVNFRAC